MNAQKRTVLFGFIALIAVIGFTTAACGGGGGGPGPIPGPEPNPLPIGADAVISIADIVGVTPPEMGQTPVTAVTPIGQYTGTVAWDPPVSGVFLGSTEYTATVTLTAEPGWTLQGVAADFFKVALATTVTNAANSGAVTAKFPVTGAVPPTKVSIAAIPGVPAPVLWAAPVTAITETTQYMGTVTWGPAVPGAFDGPIAYTATIYLTAKPGFTFDGVGENFFTVAGATTVSNPANSGTVTAIFPATGAPPYKVGGTGPGGGIIFYYDPGAFTVEGYGDPGDPGYFASYSAHYLEAQPSKFPSEMKWAALSTPAYGLVPGLSTGMNGDDRAIGRGRRNTALILDCVTSPDTDAPAAYACNNSAYGGQTDWFLLSYNELIEMVRQRTFLDIGEYTYWSSSQYGSTQAIGINVAFGMSEQQLGLKSYTRSVRAVRAF